MNHREGLSQSWLIIQGSLFPWLQEELGPLTEKQQQLVMILELIRIESQINSVAKWTFSPRQIDIIPFNACYKSILMQMKRLCLKLSGRSANIRGCQQLFGAQLIASNLKTDSGCICLRL